MSVITSPIRGLLQIWILLWTWTYPLAGQWIAEYRRRPLQGGMLKRTIETIRFALLLPVSSRSSNYAERASETSTKLPDGEAAIPNELTKLERWRAEPIWRASLRESLVWSTLALWLVSATTIVISVIVTGDFLFETHPADGSPGYVSNYFKIAALSAVLPIPMSLVAGSTLAVTSRNR